MNNDLEKVFELQRKFQERLDPTVFTSMGASPDMRAAFMRNHFVFCVQELNEALYEVPYFKPWKDYSGMSDLAHIVQMRKVQEELVDAFHFFVNLCLASGMSSQDLLDGYFEKNKENIRRQEDGYTHDVSYRG